MPRWMFAVGILGGLIVFQTGTALGQTQTSGRLTGTVLDQGGAAVPGANVLVKDPARAKQFSVVTDGSGNYSLPFLPPAVYELDVSAKGFRNATLNNVEVGLSDTTTQNVRLQLAQSEANVDVVDSPPLVRSDSSELETTIESRSLAELPLAANNFLQLAITAPGTSAPLVNNSAVGRNSPNFSINGARVTQNSYQVNGVNAIDSSMHALDDVAVPAPDTISEIKVQTSMFDASVGTGGGNLTILTKSGTNSLHGSVYEQFQNEALNANDPNLRQVGLARPVMKRNVFGFTAGGPVRKDKTFFFTSYQGSREKNGATDRSLYKSVLIAPGLTDDRSEATLMREFSLNAIDPTSLNLLNLKLPNGQYLIPTPQTEDGLVTGSAIATFREDQFNANLDYYFRQQDSLSAKFFFADSPLFSPLGGSLFGFASTLPGFGTQLNLANRVLSVTEAHMFSQKTLNEVRFGLNFIRHNEIPQESVLDSELNIQRSTASEYPGLPLILLARDQGGASIGTSDITLSYTAPSLTFTDVVSLERGKHQVQVGGGLLHSQWKANGAVYSYGEIDFPTFNDFLIGNTGPSQFITPPTSGFAHLGTGVNNRDFLTTDFHVFVQDNWRLANSLTLTLGLRYELDLPPYDTQGRIGSFDPELYLPRMEVDTNGMPVGPPVRGIVEAGNALPQYTLAEVTKVGRRVLKSIDPNNFGPRVGFAWAPLKSKKLAVRAGYGIFFSRPSFFYLAFNYFAPPFFLDSDTSGQPFNDPFANAPPSSSFPLVQIGQPIDQLVVDRNNRTPYVQQFNASIQYEMTRNTTLQLAYVGSRGVKLLDTVFPNQARIASVSHPIVNAVNGETITDNTAANAGLRAPFQGVDPFAFQLNQTSGESTYHSLQIVLCRHWLRGLQFTAGYTYSKSMDNGSDSGGGANADGTINRGGGGDTGTVWGNQLAPHANRGLSDFDVTHRFVASFVWELPKPAVHGWQQTVLTNWQLSGIITAMSGLPIDIFDSTGGSFYGFLGARPNWAPGANRHTATTHVPTGYYFNPAAFTQAIVLPGQPIPSAQDPTALAADIGTDIGDVGRNVLRGPTQTNLDLAVGKYFSLRESTKLEFRADFFNALNHANRDNPISDISAPDFGRVVSFSGSPRIVQLALRFAF